jgi:hypothetical protein
MPQNYTNVETSPNSFAKRSRSNTMNIGLGSQAGNTESSNTGNSQNHVFKTSQYTKGLESLAQKPARHSQRKRILITKRESPFAMTPKSNKQKFVSDESRDSKEHSIESPRRIQISKKSNSGKKITESPFSQKSTVCIINDNSLVMPGNDSEDYLDEFQESELVETFFFQPSLDSFSDLIDNLDLPIHNLSPASRDQDVSFRSSPMLAARQLNRKDFLIRTLTAPCQSKSILLAKPKKSEPIFRQQKTAEFTANVSNTKASQFGHRNSLETSNTIKSTVSPMISNDWVKKRSLQVFRKDLLDQFEETNLGES